MVDGSGAILLGCIRGGGLQKSENEAKMTRFVLEIGRKCGKIGSA